MALLREERLITDAQIESVRRGRRANQTLFEAVVDSGIVREEELSRILETGFGIDSPDLSREVIDPEAFKLLSAGFMKENCLCPVNFDGEGRLRVAMPDPTDLTAIDLLKQCLPCNFVPVFSPREAIERKMDFFLKSESRFLSALEKVYALASQKRYLEAEYSDGKAAILTADQSPVVELVHNLIHDAVREQASDIHIEPSEQDVELRYRIDGKMRVKSRIPKSAHRHIVSRLKILAVMDITETRRPQDGRMQVAFHNKNINLRVSALPTIFGEKIVLRILDPGEVDVDIDRLGLDAQDYLNLQSFIRQPQGMILVCGPTGSGKTTTLYSALKAMRSPEKNILTIEDPVEYTISGINQIQVNEKIGFTFATGLRTILRQDPDSILVGEIRDQETAQIAFRSSLTGHLVLSSLHTNGAVSAVTRLLDMGIEPFVIASSILGIVAQRLLRVNCTHCSKRYLPPVYLMNRYRDLLDKHGVRDFYKGEGCPACRGTGFKGRVGVFEFLVFSDHVRRMVANRASENDIRDCVIEQSGFREITESGVLKVLEGVTTLEEMDCVLGSREDGCYEDDGRGQDVLRGSVFSRKGDVFYTQRTDSCFVE